MNWEGYDGNWIKSRLILVIYTGLNFSRIKTTVRNKGYIPVIGTNSGEFITPREDFRESSFQKVCWSKQDVLLAKKKMVVYPSSFWVKY